MSYFVPGFSVTDRYITVPLDWAADGGETIDIFWREVCAAGRQQEDLPLLVFLQGGPGGKSPRPMPASGWLAEAVQYYRVILPDQRGTGRSTPVIGRQLPTDPAASADYLSHFLADSIVRDFEHIRQNAYDGVKWTSLGQSYGGFLTLTYLSLFPTALNACLVVGGIPGLPPNPNEVYRRTFPRARRKSELFYQRYPQDVELVAQIADVLSADNVLLPNGDRFCVPRLQALGMDLGMKPGAERLHWLFDEAFARPGQLSDTFLQQVYYKTSAADDPLFWTLQEFIYGCGDNGPMNWAAQRELAKHPDFAPDKRPLLFTGEHTFKWMFTEISELRPFGPAVELLMQRVSWPLIYDPARLETNEVPVQSLQYFDDLYVDVNLQQETLTHLGNSAYWVTNEYEHDGIQSPQVFTKLRQLLIDRGGSLRD